MTEKEIQFIGFLRVEENCVKNPYYYYVYRISDGVELISSANNEVESGEWKVEFSESNPRIVYTNCNDVDVLIKLLTKGLQDDCI
jgi:hypothetical protein